MSGPALVGSASPAFGALAHLLEEMARVVAQLTPEEYAGSHIPGVSGSIGGHVRHCLDHVRALEVGVDRGLVDYDLRRRNTTVEHDREAAVLSLMAAASRAAGVSDTALRRTVFVRSMISTSGISVESASSVARELAFVISHTIHHNAQIALLAHRAGAVWLPERFGVAPSTPALAGAA